MARLEEMRLEIETLEDAHRYNKASEISDRYFALVMIVEAKWPGTFK